jgi:hypothetical protein
MAQSFRFLLRGVQGRHSHNINMPGVIKNRFNVVHITAGEAIVGQPSETVGPRGNAIEQTWAYHIGAADVWVSNVSPHDDAGGGGGVEFVVHADWGSPIDVGVTITVEDQIPFEIQN